MWVNVLLNAKCNIPETCKHFMDDVIAARELSVQTFYFKKKKKYFKLNEV